MKYIRNSMLLLVLFALPMHYSVAHGMSLGHWFTDISKNKCLAMAGIAIVAAGVGAWWLKKTFAKKSPGPCSLQKGKGCVAGSSIEKNKPCSVIMEPTCINHSVNFAASSMLHALHRGILLFAACNTPHKTLFLNKLDDQELHEATFDRWKKEALIHALITNQRSSSTTIPFDVTNGCGTVLFHNVPINAEHLKQLYKRIVEDYVQKISNGSQGLPQFLRYVTAYTEDMKNNFVCFSDDEQLRELRHYCDWVAEDQVDKRRIYESMLEYVRTIRVIDRFVVEGFRLSVGTIEERLHHGNDLENNSDGIIDIECERVGHLLNHTLQGRSVPVSRVTFDGDGFVSSPGLLEQLKNAFSESRPCYTHIFLVRQGDDWFTIVLHVDRRSCTYHVVDSLGIDRVAEWNEKGTECALGALIYLVSNAVRVN